MKLKTQKITQLEDLTFIVAARNTHTNEWFYLYRKAPIMACEVTDDQRRQSYKLSLSIYACEEYSYKTARHYADELARLFPIYDVRIELVTNN